MPTRPVMNSAKSPRDNNFDSTPWFSQETKNDINCNVIAEHFGQMSYLMNTGYIWSPTGVKGETSYNPNQIWLSLQASCHRITPDIGRQHRVRVPISVSQTTIPNLPVFRSIRKCWWERLWIEYETCSTAEPEESKWISNIQINNIFVWLYICLFNIM